MGTNVSCVNSLNMLSGDSNLVPGCSFVLLTMLTVFNGSLTLNLSTMQQNQTLSMVNISGLNVYNGSSLNIISAASVPGPAVHLYVSNSQFSDSSILISGTFPSHSIVSIEGCSFTQTYLGSPFGVRLANWVLCYHSFARFADCTLRALNADGGFVSVRHMTNATVCDNSSIALRNVSGATGTLLAITDHSLMLLSHGSSLLFSSIALIGHGALFTLDDSSSFILANASAFAAEDSSTAFQPFYGTPSPIPAFSIARNSTFVVQQGSSVSILNINFDSVGMTIVLNLSTFTVRSRSSFVIANAKLSSTISLIVVAQTNFTVSESSSFRLANSTLSTGETDAFSIQEATLIFDVNSTLFITMCTVIAQSIQFFTEPIAGLAFRSSQVILRNGSSMVVEQITVKAQMLAGSLRDFANVILFDSTWLTVASSSGVEFSNSAWSTIAEQSVTLFLIRDAMMLVTSSSYFLLTNVSFSVANSTTSDSGCMAVLLTSVKLSHNSVWAIRNVEMTAGSTSSAMAFQSSTFEVAISSRWNLESMTLYNCGIAGSPSCLTLQFVVVVCHNDSAWLASALQLIPAAEAVGQKGSGLGISDSIVVVDWSSQWITSESNFSGLLLVVGNNVSINVSHGSLWLFSNITEVALSIASSLVAVRSSSWWSLQQVTGAYIMVTDSKFSFVGNSSWHFSGCALEPISALISFDTPFNVDASSTILVSGFSSWIVHVCSFTASSFMSWASFLVDASLTVEYNSTWIIQSSVLNATAAGLGAALKLSGSFDISQRSAWIIQNSTFVGVLQALYSTGIMTYSDESWFGIISNIFVTIDDFSSNCFSFGTIIGNDQSYVSYVFNNCTSKSVFDATKSSGQFLYKCNFFNDSLQVGGYPDGALSTGSCTSTCSTESECFRFLTVGNETCVYVDQEENTVRCPCDEGGVGSLCQPGLAEPAVDALQGSRSGSASMSLTSVSVSALSLMATQEVSISNSKSMSRSRMGSVSETTEAWWSSSVQTGSNSLVSSPSLTVAVPVPSIPISIVSAPARQAAVTAVAASTAISAIAGPSGASDVQAVAVLLLVPCVGSSGKAKLSGYGTLSPVALNDSPAGLLLGNIIACGAIALAQLLVVTALWMVHRDRQLFQALATARFPGILLTTAASLFQGTLVASLALIGAPETIAEGVAGLSWSLALPAVVVFGVRRIPRRFVSYLLLDQTTRFYTFRKFLPTGVIFPVAVRKSSSALICGLMAPSVTFATWSFLSPLILAVVTVIPANASHSTCQAALWVSCALHLVLAVATVVLGVQRSLTTQVLSAGGLILTAVGHVLVATGAPQSSTDSLMLLQSAFAIFRCAVLVLLLLAEKQMLTCAGICLRSESRWQIGDGGATMDEVDNPPSDAAVPQDDQDDNDAVGPVVAVRIKSSVDDNRRVRPCLDLSPRARYLLLLHDQNEACNATKRAAALLVELQAIHTKRTSEHASRVLDGRSQLDLLRALNLVVSCITYGQTAKNADKRLRME